MFAMMRFLGWICLASWIILESVRYRRFGNIDPWEPGDLARGRWFLRHPVLLVLVLQATLVASAIIFLLPVFFFGSENEAAFDLVYRSMFMAGIGVFSVLGVLRIRRGAQRGLPKHYVRLQAMSLFVWAAGTGLLLTSG